MPSQGRDQAPRLPAGALHQLGEPVDNDVLVQCKDVGEHEHVVRSQRDLTSLDSAQRPDEVEVGPECRLDGIGHGREAGGCASGGNHARAQIDVERCPLRDDRVELELVEVCEERGEQLTGGTRAPLELPQIAGREAPIRLAGERTERDVARGARLVQGPAEPGRPTLGLQSYAVS